jgi:hypothetical protein
VPYNLQKCLTNKIKIKDDKFSLAGFKDAYLCQFCTAQLQKGLSSRAENSYSDNLHKYRSPNHGNISTFREKNS